GSPVRLEFERFSGEVSGGLLGSPAGQVFLSPAFGASPANSVLEIESVAVCTRSSDVYEIPQVPWRSGPTLLRSTAGDIAYVTSRPLLIQGDGSVERPFAWQHAVTAVAGITTIVFQSEDFSWL